MPITLRYEDYTIGWICAIQVEVVAARFMLDEKHDGVFPGKIGDENHYIPGTINGHNVVIVGLPKKSIGNVSAASLVSQMRQSFVNLRYGLMVGIGAGVPGPSLRPDIRLGDVVVAAPSDESDDAQGVIGYELGKETVNGFVKKNTLYPTDRRLRAAFESIQAEAEFDGTYIFLKYLEAFRSRPAGKKFLHPGLENDELYRTDDTSTLIQREPRDSPDPVVHYGLIASGDKLVKNAKLRDELRDKYGIICFEMEAAGLMNTLPVAVIRGVCDYADSHKNDVWHHYAAATAAAFAKGLLYTIGADPSANPPPSREEVPTAILKLREIREGTNFGRSVDDVAVLTYLAQKTLRGVKTSFGDQGELTREVAYMYRVLKRLRRELGTPDSFLNGAEDDLRQDITELGNGCMRILMRTEDVLVRYNSLPEEKKTTRRPWSRSKPLSAEMQELAEIKRTLSAHTSAMTVCLDLCSSRGQRIVEKQLRNLAELKGIPEMTSKIAAKMTAKNGDGTVWTSYKDDDSAFWKKLRRKLVKSGFGSSVLDKHEDLIKEYVEELGRRGVFDQTNPAPATGPSTSSIYHTRNDIEIDEVGMERTNIRSSGSIPSELAEVGKHQDVESLEVEKATSFDSDPNMDLMDIVQESVATSSKPIKTESHSLATEEEAVCSPVVHEQTINTSSLVPDSAEAAEKPDDQISISVLARPVQIQEAIDEDFLPSAHPNVGDPPKPVHVEEIMDEEFLPGAHPSMPAAKYWRPINLSTEAIPLSLKNILQDRSRESRNRETFWDVAEQIRLKSKAQYNSASSNTWSKYQTHDRDQSGESDANTEEENEEDEEEGGKEKSIEENERTEEWSSDTPNYVFFSTKTLDPDLRKLEPLTLKDTIGRKFTFPFYMCNTWEGIHELIVKAFESIDRFGPLVSKGYYDLISPDGDIILPKAWSHLVEPGWAITMAMWPIPKSAIPVPAEMKQDQRASATDREYDNDPSEETPRRSEPIPKPTSPTPTPRPQTRPSPQPSRRSDPPPSPPAESSKPSKSTQKEDNVRLKSRKKGATESSTGRKGFFSGLKLGKSKPESKKTAPKKDRSAPSSSTSQSKQT